MPFGVIGRSRDEAGIGVWGSVHGPLLYYMGVDIVQGEEEVLGFLFPIITMGNAVGLPTVKCFRFVCVNFTTFPFGKHIIGKLHSWAFW